MADKKFSGFTDGGEMRVGDIPVGLRTSDLTQNYKFDFPGTGIKDSSGNYLIGWASAGAASVNYPKVTSSLTTNGVIYGAAGTDANIKIRIVPKGSAGIELDGLNWPTVDGSANTFLYTDGAGNLGWASAAFPIAAGAAGTILRSNGTDWAVSTASFADTYGVSQILYASSANTVAGLTTANNGVLVTNGSGVPSIGSTLPTAVQSNITSLGTIASGVWHGTVVEVTYGGSGRASATAYALIAGGTASTNPHQSLTTGSLGQLLYSKGNASLPTWTTPTYPVISGSAGQILRSDGTNIAYSTATYPDTTTQNRILYSSATNTVSEITSENSAVLITNASGVPSFSSTMTNGQLVIGNTGNAPSVATLTAGTGISITNAAGSITISSGGGGYSWTEVTGTSQAMSVNSGYIANNAGLVTLTLPLTATIGQTIIIQGKGAGLFKIAQNAGQTIHLGSSATTTGVGGYLESTNQFDSLEILCITNDTDWAVLTGTQGIFTVV